MKLINLLVFCLLGANIFAQTDIRDVKFSCDQAVKMGRDKFADMLTQKANDQSEIAYDYAYEKYAECKRSANNVRLKKLNGEQKKRVESLRKTLDWWEDRLIGLRSLSQGGGTMFNHWANRSPAHQEDVLGEVIGWMQKPSANTSARSKATANWNKLQLKVNALASPDKETKEMLKMQEDGAKLYQETYADFKKANAQLKTLLAALPDSAAVSITNFLVAEMGKQ